VARTALKGRGEPGSDHEEVIAVIGVIRRDAAHSFRDTHLGGDRPYRDREVDVAGRVVDEKDGVSLGSVDYLL
jgi:hypothetical protein